MTSSRRTSQQLPYDYSFKVLVLGDIGVGKTKLLERFCQGYYQEAYKSTLGLDLVEKQLEVDNTAIRLQIWDTAGQERYRTLTSSFYRGAMGVILIYDITVPGTFRSLLSWVENIREYSFPDVAILLVGSKSDLYQTRQVGEKAVLAFSHEHDLPHIEASAKTGENVDELFTKLCRIMLKAKYKRRQSVSEAALLGTKPFLEEDKNNKCPTCEI